mmetsp:Transcript_19683/g.48783  ORF Transcript_19683/g.48783 Transcript_19683/m.48783 type:complete len:256 (+) Transcript_19683:69-836(+)
MATPPPTPPSTRAPLLSNSATTAAPSSPRLTAANSAARFSIATAASAPVPASMPPALDPVGIVVASRRSTSRQSSARAAASIAPGSTVAHTCSRRTYFPEMASSASSNETQVLATGGGCSGAKPASRPRDASSVESSSAHVSDAPFVASPALATSISAAAAEVDVSVTAAATATAATSLGVLPASAAGAGADAGAGVGSVTVSTRRPASHTSLAASFPTAAKSANTGMVHASRSSARDLTFETCAPKWRWTPAHR